MKKVLLTAAIIASLAISSVSTVVAQEPEKTPCEQPAPQKSEPCQKDEQKKDEQAPAPAETPAPAPTETPAPAPAAE